TSEDSAVYYCA
nr:immunoglobulin heavy chain junction region [Mus musculus]